MDEKTGTVRVYCAQFNPVVGDIKGNFEKMVNHIISAAEMGSDIVAFPELALTGYPPEDLLLKPAFIEENIAYLAKIKEFSADITVIAGFVNRASGIYNSAAVISNKKIAAVYNKQYLPDYSVFDEERYFCKGTENFVFKMGNISFGVNICEDIFYSPEPVRAQAIAGGAELIINLSASPYYEGKIHESEKILFTRAVENRVNILYVNLVGGQDELVFDGNSMLIDEKGEILCRAKPFKEDFFIYDIPSESVNSARLQDAKYINQQNELRPERYSVKLIEISPVKKHVGVHKRAEIVKKPGQSAEGAADTQNKNSVCGSKAPIANTDNYKKLISCAEEEIFEALVLGTRDYAKKNGFSRVVLGLSGGLDSALVAVIASFAVGSRNVTGVIMPSIYSSKGSIDDSLALSEKTGIGTIIIPISSLYSEYLESLKDNLKTSGINITKENLQARIRGNILMSLSNEHGWLVLTTGNKSEISVGYCTLYGDMAGGFSPIKDIYKTFIYRICNFLNKKYANIIPDEIIIKAPSAELKPGQTDQDRLPPYEVLDKILKAYIEDEKDYREIVKSGLPENIVKNIINMVDFNEYKIRQVAPGIKITPRAFSRDRRYPITNKFRLL